MRIIDKRFLVIELEQTKARLDYLRRSMERRNKNLNALITALIYLIDMEISELTEEIGNE